MFSAIGSRINDDTCAIGCLTVLARPFLCRTAGYLCVGVRMLLHVENITKSYPNVPVLHGVSFDLRAGEMLALTGESGSGKSTLLHLIGGLDSADSGVIAIDGAAMTGLDDGGRAKLRRDVVGVIFQQFNLIPSLDVGANIAFHARLAGRHDAGRCAHRDKRLARLWIWPMAISIFRRLQSWPKLLLNGLQAKAIWCCWPLMPRSLATI